MATSRLQLRGSRGWLAVAVLTLLLAAFAVSQLRPTVAHADLTPVAQTVTLSPSVAASPATDPATDVTHVVEPPVPPVPAVSPAALVPTVSPAATAVAALSPRPSKKAPPAAAAPTSDVCSGPGWEARRGQSALATLRDTGQRSGVSVAFQGAKAGYLGLTYPARRHVDVFVRSCSAESAALLRHVVSHEMGHAYDAAQMSPALREAYLAMRGIPASAPWFGCSYCTDFATPAGDFAETYSQWQRGSHDSRTTIAPMPSDTQLAAIAAAFFQG